MIKLTGRMAEQLEQLSSEKLKDATSQRGHIRANLFRKHLWKGGSHRDRQYIGNPVKPMFS